MSLKLPRQKESDISSVDEAEYDLLHDVNTKGILHCLQEEISVMKSQEIMYVEGRSGHRQVGPGSIVNVTSLSAILAMGKTTTYVASKFAARGIIKCAGEFRIASSSQRFGAADLFFPPPSFGELKHWSPDQ